MRKTRLRYRQEHQKSTMILISETLYGLTTSSSKTHIVHQDKIARHVNPMHRFECQKRKLQQVGLRVANSGGPTSCKITNQSSLPISTHTIWVFSLARPQFNRHGTRPYPKLQAVKFNLRQHSLNKDPTMKLLDDRSAFNHLISTNEQFPKRMDP